MRHITQHGTDDCGIAVVAMLAGVGYSEAYNHDAELHKSTSPWGMSTNEMKRLLLHVTGYEWMVTMRGYGKLFTEVAGDLSAGKYALIIRARGERYGHLIAVEVKATSDHRDTLVTVYDPDMPKPLPLDKYREKGAWKVVRIFVPVD